MKGWCTKTRTGILSKTGCPIITHLHLSLNFTLSHQPEWMKSRRYRYSHCTGPIGQPGSSHSLRSLSVLDLYTGPRFGSDLVGLGPVWYQRIYSMCTNDNTSMTDIRWVVTTPYQLIVWDKIREVLIIKLER